MNMNNSMPIDSFSDKTNDFNDKEESEQGDNRRRTRATTKKESGKQAEMDEVFVPYLNFEEEEELERERLLREKKEAGVTKEKRKQ